MLNFKIGFHKKEFNLIFGLNHMRTIMISMTIFIMHSIANATVIDYDLMQIIRCEKLASIYAEYGPEGQRDIFSNNEKWLKSYSLKFNSDEEILPDSIQYMNLNYDIKKDYLKRQKTIVYESAACSQWLEIIKLEMEKNNLESIKWIDKFPKKPKVFYVNYFEKSIGNTFDKWITKR